MDMFQSFYRKEPQILLIDIVFIQTYNINNKTF